MQRLQELKPDLTFITNDIDRIRPADYHCDATSPKFWSAVNHEGIDWVIENPPFNVEIEILKGAYKVAQQGVVFMSRVSFCEPTHTRGPWLSTHPYDKRITLERHSFTGNGHTDSATTDWLVWSKIPLTGPFGISAFNYRPR